MTKKYLQEWYNQGDITYSEKEKLNKIGVSDYGYYSLNDLKQILRCEGWARENWEIRDKLNGRIKRIVFFTPNFNSGKLDASNYSCAIVTDGNDQIWVISYRPSYVANIESDLVIEEVSNASEVENKLNGEYPGVALKAVDIFTEIINRKFCVRWKSLPYDAKNNPDRYILPLDIVTRPINDSLNHYAVYLGNKWVAELPGHESTKFVSWDRFCKGSSGGFSSSSSSGSGIIGLVHPQMLFKRKENIIRHIAKTINHGYGGCHCHFYNAATNNCESLVNYWILGFSRPTQGSNLAGGIIMGGAPELIMGSLSLLGPTPSSTANNFKTFFSSLTEMGFPSEASVIRQSERFENLASSFSSEKERIEDCIRNSENNRSYTRPKYQIEQEKFETRIEVYPKDWCRVS